MAAGRSDEMLAKTLCMDRSEMLPSVDDIFLAERHFPRLSPGVELLIGGYQGVDFVENLLESTDESKENVIWKKICDSIRILDPDCQATDELAKIQLMVRAQSARYKQVSYDLLKRAIHHAGPFPAKPVKKTRPRKKIVK